MALKALGIIEAIGLNSAIVAADAAAKSANVEILGYENGRGGGRITVKLIGDVGAVQAAIAAATAAGNQIGKIEAARVIPRPHDDIASLINEIDRGRKKEAVKIAPVVERSVSAPRTVHEPAPVSTSVPKPVVAGSMDAIPVSEPVSSPSTTTVSSSPKAPAGKHPSHKHNRPKGKK